MLDRLFMPALTFTLLVAATAAFAFEFSAGREPTQQVVMLERVVVTAAAQALPIAQAPQAADAPALR